LQLVLSIDFLHSGY